MSFLDNRGPKAYAVGNSLAAGGRMYVDREYVYTSIPAVLKGHAYLVTASTLDPQPSTLNSTPSTLNTQPSPLFHQPHTIRPQPFYTLNTQPSALNPQAGDRRRRRSVAAYRTVHDLLGGPRGPPLNLKPCTLNHSTPSTLNTQPSTLNTQHSTRRTCTSCTTRARPRPPRGSRPASSPRSRPSASTCVRFWS